MEASSPARGRILSTTVIGDTLAERRHVTVILRLVLDRGGRLIHGEVVDVEAGPWARFAGWRGLTRTLHAWLASQEQPEPGDPPRPSG
jgi:hypothetical protein